MDFNEFADNVYQIVLSIPLGKVMSYGQIASIVGYPKQSRRVGMALKFSPGGLPAHRVVNHAGRLVPGWQEQRSLLKEEGVAFLESGYVDMTVSQWDREFI